MTDQELEARLRAFYRSEVGEGAAAPLALRRDVAAIPRAVPQRARWFGRGRGLTLLAAAALLLVTGAIAAGSGLVRLPSVVPPEPAPSLAAVQPPSPAAETPGPTISPSPAPSVTPVVVPARAPSWAATASMTTARFGHTATLLPDGNVLVAGGYDGQTPLRTAEMYDPATGSWTATGSMAFARGGHTATLLHNGRVLVAGCAVGPGGAVVGSAELYDPASGTWAATGSMVEPRCLRFTATILSDGRVLVAGGLDEDIVATAELFDPSTGTWAATGSMTSPRYDHSATLLPDGTVLVAGGADHGGGGGRYLMTAELYDPATGTWTATGSLSAPHGGHEAQLLPDGTVLVTGDPSELYDPSAGSWTTTGSTADGHGPTVSLPDGRVLVVGTSCGTADCDPPTDVTTVEVYDPGSRSWTAVAGSPVTLRFDHTVTLLPDGRVLVAGGFSDRNDGDGSVMASAELYDPSRP